MLARWSHSQSLCRVPLRLCSVTKQRFTKRCTVAPHRCGFFIIDSHSSVYCSAGKTPARYVDGPRTLPCRIPAKNLGLRIRVCSQATLTARPSRVNLLRESLARRDPCGCHRDPAFDPGQHEESASLHRNVAKAADPQLYLRTPRLQSSGKPAAPRVQVPWPSHTGLAASTPCSGCHMEPVTWDNSQWSSDTSALLSPVPR